MTEPLRLEAFLPYRLNVLAAKVSQALARQYEQTYGLSIPEWRVVATLGQFGPLPAKVIAEHSEMDKIKVSRAVARLSDRGLVSRNRDARDGRMTELSLTRRGRKTYLEIVPEALAYESALLEGLSDADLETLDRLIVALTTKAETF